MHPRPTPLTATLSAAALLATSFVAGCSKDGAQPDKLTGSLAQQAPAAAADPSAPGAADAPAGPSDMQALIDRMGVDPGPFSVDEDAVPEAVVSAHEGPIAVRRVGEEVFTTATADSPIELYAGDQLQTGEGAHATLMLPDESRVEVAELSVIAIGDRDGDADPACSVAVLLGMARFEISARAAGEGPFLVYTPAGVANALGTAFVVGVSLTGSVRVGVDEGSVEVVGTEKVTQTATLEADTAVSLSASGALSATAKLEGDWGAWRAEQDAKVEPAAVMEAQIEAAEATEAKIEASYGMLYQGTAKAMAAAQDAEALEQKDDVAGYQASAEARARVIERPFLVSLRLQQLSFAMQARAYVAQQLYLRHPDKLGPRFEKHRDLVARAVLLDKKYHLAARTIVEPMRGAYHRHHPRGRARAKAVGAKLPAFFAKAELAPLADDAAKDGAEPMYRPRRPSKVDAKRRIQPRGVAHGWYAKLKDSPRAKGHGEKGEKDGAPWFAMAPAARASLVMAQKPKRAAEPLLGMHAPKPRAQAAQAWAKRDAAHPGRHLALGHAKNRGEDERGQPAVNPAGHVLPAQAPARGLPRVGGAQHAVPAHGVPGHAHGKDAPGHGHAKDAPGHAMHAPGKSKTPTVAKVPAMPASAGGKGKPAPAPAPAAKPAKPAMPATPATPAKPAKPATPGKPTDTAAPGNGNGKAKGKP